MEAESNRNIIHQQFQNYSEDPENVNLQQVWKTMSKLWPKVGATLPTAKKNHAGRIISEPNELKQLLTKEYKERLRERPVMPDLGNLKLRKSRIFKMKLMLAEANFSDLWTMSDLENALADLKDNKSRDNDGLINEIFKKNVIGTDLKKSLLLMYNKLKIEQLIAIFMNYANITTLPKQGSCCLRMKEEFFACLY